MSRLIAITSFPVLDIRVPHRTPNHSNHSKGRIPPQAEETCLATRALVIFSLTIVHHITSLAIDPFLLSCRQVARVTVVDMEAVWPAETVEAVVYVARATQVMVTAVVVVVVAVAVGVATRPISTGTQPPEEYAIFIGPLGPAIAGSTAPTNTRQGFRHPRPSQHSPRIILPTFSRWKGWPRTMVLL